MKVKTIFNEFEVNVQDAVFTLKEINFKEVISKVGKYTPLNGTIKVELNPVDLINGVLGEAIVSWKGVNKEDNTPLLYSKENLLLLDVEVKTEIFNALSLKCNLTEEEKKS